MRTLTRRTALAACAVGLAASVAASVTGAAAGADRLGRYHAQRIDWHGCARGPGDETGRELDAAGAGRAEITVPLDYADPGGRTITVAISRIEATDTGHRAPTATPAWTPRSTPTCARDGSPATT